MDGSHPRILPPPLKHRPAPGGEPFTNISAFRALIGPRPPHFEKPRYATPAYALARSAGWITDDEEQADRVAYEKRRRRSLRTSHRYALHDEERFEPPADSGAYVPELAARLDDDRNLTDGARRCARKLAEHTYRRNREGRSLEVTVTYLMRALGRCRRTVQRYLRLLERAGYIQVDVAYGERSRMCAGLVVHLLRPLFARHHREKWPAKAAKPDATKESHNNRFIYKPQDSEHKVSRSLWALKCMNGVFRSLMEKTGSLQSKSALVVPSL